MKASAGSFIYQQEFFYDVSEDYSLNFNIYVFDTIQTHSQYTTEITRNYIVNQPVNISFDVELEKDSVIFRNQFYDLAACMPDFLSRDIIEEEVSLDTLAFEPISDTYNDGWPQLSVSTTYKEILKYEDGTLELAVNKLHAETFLMLM